MRLAWSIHLGTHAGKAGVTRYTLQQWEIGRWHDVSLFWKSQVSRALRDLVLEQARKFVSGIAAADLPEIERIAAHEQ